MLLKDLEKHDSSSTQHHLSLALNKLTNQDQLISELQATAVTQREQFLATQNELLRTQTQLLERLRKMENQSELLTFFQDEHIWSIPRFSEEIKKAKQSTWSYYLSKQIYTSKGYRLQCMLYPHNQKNKNVGIYFQTIEGNFDDDLSWPINNLEIKLCVIDNNGNKKEECTIFIAGRKQFLKPPHSHGQSGLGAFILSNKVAEYTPNDILTIRIKAVHS